MNLAHWHIAINHSPVYCVLIGLLLLVVGRLRRSADIAFAAHLLFVLGALLAIPTYMTGKKSSRVLRGLEGIDREFTRAHSAAAYQALIATLILGAVAAWALWEWRAKAALSSRVTNLIWLLAIVSAGLMYRTSMNGGEVRHTEARPGFIVPTEDPNAPPPGGAPPAAMETPAP